MRAVHTRQAASSQAPRRVQVVWAHPRQDSLAAGVVADVRQVIEQHRLDADVLDLYRLGFDPVLSQADEPDWEDLDKVYDPETMELIGRTENADAIVFVFPVWWYSFPAVMKGYIDRVWNYGRFYGDGRRIGIDSVLWIGLAGDTQHAFRKRNYDRMMEHYLNVGIAGYCGFSDSRVELLFDTFGDHVDDAEAHTVALREQAGEAVTAMLGRAFGETRVA